MGISPNKPGLFGLNPDVRVWHARFLANIFLKKSLYVYQMGYNHPGSCLDKHQGTTQFMNLFAEEFIMFRYRHIPITLDERKKYRLCIKTWCSTCILRHLTLLAYPLKAITLL